MGILPLSSRQKKQEQTRDGLRFIHGNQTVWRTRLAVRNDEVPGSGKVGLYQRPNNVSLPLHIQKESIQGFGGKAQGKRPLGRASCRWEDAIRVDLREIGWGWGGSS
jgi:hypothetical protein